MNSFFRLKRSQKGFTLLEVMIAIAIFSIGILGVIKMQIRSQVGNTSARTITQGTTYAQDAIENIMMSTYTPSIPIAGVFTPPPTVDPTSGESYNISYVITANNPITNTSQIAMTVTWNDQGRTKTFTTNYYKAMDF